MPPTTVQPDALPALRWRGRLQLILILGVVIAPMLLAGAMYRWQFWVPEGRHYHGELVAGGQTLAQLGVVAPTGHWQLLVTAPGACAADCRQLVFLARQIHIGLNREAARARHALAVGAPLEADYQARLEREYPQLRRYPLHPGLEAGAGARLWIVDPHGNLVLRYDAASRGKAILDDLRHLLKISQIG